jgi:uncharacterized phage protein (TIGR02218 family)
MIELYEFTDGGTVYRYTSASRDVSYAGHTWTAIAIQRGPTALDREAEKNALQIDVPTDNPVALAHVRYPPDTPMAVRVFSGDTIDDMVVIMRGVVAGVMLSSYTATIEVRDWMAIFDRPTPRLRYQQLCRWALYSRGCGVNKESFRLDGTVSAISSDRLYVDAAIFATQPNGWLQGGTVTIRGQTRLIISHLGSGTIQISQQIEGLQLADTLIAYAGCGRTRDACNGKFSNSANFGGFTTLPPRNPHERSILR